MADDLPVWTIRPNWRGGITERLEWLTDVLASETNVEQRRSLRRTPRRSFEATFHPTDDERSFLDLILHRLGGKTWLFPVWHDQARLSEPVTAAGKRLTFDNTFREFVVSGKALVFVGSFAWRLVEITSQDANGLTIAAEIGEAFDQGTPVYPLLKCTLDGTTSLGALTSRVGESVLRFLSAEPNPYPENIGADASYNGSPVLTAEPNRAQTLGLDHVRFIDEADGEAGLRYQVDETDRSFSVQAYNWQLRGRQAHAEFRSFLYRLRGRQKPLYLPTFNADLHLTRAALEGAFKLVTRRTGYTYVGSGQPIVGRNRLWTGREGLEIESVSSAPTEDAFMVTPALEASYAPDQVLSFLNKVRLNQDAIELLHHTDSDGMTEVAATFSAIEDRFVAEDVLLYEVYWYGPTDWDAEMVLPSGEAISRTNTPVDGGVFDRDDNPWFPQKQFGGGDFLQHGNPLADIRHVETITFRNMPPAGDYRIRARKFFQPYADGFSDPNLDRGGATVVGMRLTFRGEVVYDDEYESGAYGVVGEERFSIGADGTIRIGVG